MSGIHATQMLNGIQVIWTTPLSGFAHVADEQPLPYLHIDGKELTPRFGGDNHDKTSGIDSLPLPYGRLSKQWPLEQRFFNLFRRKVNIYWRHAFQSRSNAEHLFYFLEQLDYIEVTNGFTGTSPTLDFSRTFLTQDNTVLVNDSITLKKNIQFSELFICPWADFEPSNVPTTCKISASLAPNYSKSIRSSTGSARWHAHKLTDIRFKKGDTLKWNYLYQIDQSN